MEKFKENLHQEHPSPNNDIKYDILFPHLDDIEKYNKLQIDRKSISLISTCSQSKIITFIIKKHLNNIHIQYDDVVITDMTAGVGGNAIHFAMNFKYVNAIEIDKIRSEYLENNMNVYELQNLKVYSGDSINTISDIYHDVLFIDPPWGGTDYKNKDQIRLSLGTINIEDLINLISSGTINRCIPKLIVLKLPKNYDIEYFKKSVIYKNIKFDNMKKITIVTLYL